MERNLCVNYAIFADGRIEYLGAAEQIISDQQRYLGNWLEPAGTEPPLLIQAGFQLMRKAYQQGYRGFAGFDAAIGKDGSFRIYDLNFRFNGSTVPLLLYDDLARSTGLAVAKYSGWKHKGSFDGMLRSLRQAIADYPLFPFCIFDPARCHENYTAEPSISALLFGISQEDIVEKEHQLGALGFYQ
jgi:hypothetical protein